MRLLRIEVGGDFSLVERSGSNIPPYAILSHTWGGDEDEVTFKDWNNGTAKTKVGYNKIRSCGEQAATDGLQYFWVDTCCIDKSSSAELSEAINSMYIWYQAADVCYAYLSDVPSKKSFSSSKWFTRGWTLQELLAPAEVVFFDERWDLLGSLVDLQQAVSDCTGIPVSLLSGAEHLEAFSIAQRMSWAARRETKRVEDRAYCLMGIFDVNMPLIYGEGENAFIRLQEEIMKISEDYSIFAWRSDDVRGGCLATSPASFSSSGNITRSDPSGMSNDPTILSSKGVHLDIPFIHSKRRHHGFAILNCCERGSEDLVIAIHVMELGKPKNRVERIFSKELAQLDLQTFRQVEYRVERVCIQKGRIGRLHGSKVSREPDSITCQDTDSMGFVRNLVHAGSSNALFEAVKKGCKDETRLLLTREDTEVNAVSGERMTALTHAAFKGNEEITSILLDRTDIQVDSEDALGRTPLLWATWKGHEGVVKLLLETGKLNVNQQNGDHETPLYNAVQGRYEAVVKLLLDTGKVDVNQQNRDGETPLIQTARSGDEKILKLLLETGKADVNQRGIYYETPLSIAARLGHTEVVKILLNNSKFNVDLKDMNNKTPLDYAVEFQHQAVVELLKTAKRRKNLLFKGRQSYQ